MWAFFILHPLLKGVNKSVEGKWFQDKHTVWLSHHRMVKPLSSACLSFTWFDKWITEMAKMFVADAELFFSEMQRVILQSEFHAAKESKGWETNCLSIVGYSRDPWRGTRLNVANEHASTTITLKLLFLCINNKYWISDLFSLKLRNFCGEVTLSFCLLILTPAFNLYLLRVASVASNQ